jgi:hypothetical protein
VPFASEAATEIAATRSGTKPMIGPPSFVGGSFGPGSVAIIIVRIAASGIAMPRAGIGDWCCEDARIVREGDVDRDSVLISHPPEQQSTVGAGQHAEHHPAGCAPRGMQDVPVGPLCGSGAKYRQKPPFEVGVA